MSRLASLDVSSIDIEAARRHFDLPVDDLTTEELRRILEGTRADFISMIGEDTTIPIWRGMVVEREWLDSLHPGVSLGRSWAYAVEGAERFSRADGDELGIILQATVEVDEIDWPMTIAVNAFTVEECEILLPGGAIITLTGIEGASPPDAISGSYPA